MDLPKVSVIIPVYNAEKYLRDCLNSVVNQTLKDIEIICVDDGSEDSSLAILEEYRERDQRIKVLSQPNQGAGLARNNGILSAEGEYICFLDSDDFYPESVTLEKLYNKAYENHALICGGSISHFLASGKIVTNYDPEMLWGYTFKEEGWIDYRDYQFDYGFTRFLYSREMLIQHDLFFSVFRFFEDPPFFVQAMILAGRFYAIPDITYRYRVIDKTVAIQTSREKTRDLLIGLSANLALAQKNDLRKLFELTVKRCVRDFSTVLNAAAEKNDDEFNVLLIKLNITASEVTDGKPNAFFQMQAKNELLEEKNRVLQSDLDFVRPIIWIPRKLRGGVRCFRDHGAGYTIRRTLYHMGLWKDEEKQKEGHIS